MKAELHPAADDELWEQVAYYEARQPGLGDLFAASIHAAFELLLDHPDLGERIGRQCRRLSVRGFPHTIVYQHAETGLFVLAVGHEKRRPGYWQNRVPAE